jgi:hypothetical protein
MRHTLIDSAERIPPAAPAQSAATPEDAHAITVDADIDLYPLL